MSGEEAIIVWSTAPDKAVAERLAEALVTEKLAACVHIFAPGHSFYIWEGALEREAEQALMIKTRRPLLPKLQDRLAELHPYDVPEILAVDVAAGLPRYLSWLAESTPLPKDS